MRRTKEVQDRKIGNTRGRQGVQGEDKNYKWKTRITRGIQSEQEEGKENNVEIRLRRIQGEQGSTRADFYLTVSSKVPTTLNEET